MADIARTQWEIENNVSLEADTIYQYDEAEQDALRQAEPWKKDPKYFKKVKISGISLLKMVLHARAGCSEVPGKDPDYEVMGLLQGKIDGDTIVVMDSFPVCQGNEVRVNAGVADFEFMVQYTESVGRVGKEEPAVGWYHSHPGYGVWLSGIDVKTQTENQTYQDPWIAIVVDPKQTMSTGKVEIGAFRVFPKDYTPPADQSSEWQYIPKDRIEAEQDALRQAEPWKKDPKYFKKVKISGISLLKMVLHARAGCSEVPGKDPDYEVMGLLQGKIDGDTIVVMDSFPVCQGNEVRVNAGVADFEFMVQYTESVGRVGKEEPAVGWYHSHPGYGVWLSGIDVKTQTENQTYQDPWIAIVVDPKQTMSTGKVEIGAFRVFPKDYTPPADQSSEWQYIPKDRIEEFGVHASSYYPLECSVFKSSLDSSLFRQLWTKYWVKTLTSSSNIATLDYSSKLIEDLASKLEKAEREISTTRSISVMGGGGKKPKEKEISKLTKDSATITVSQLNGVMNQVIKQSLFNTQ
eukprot:TRINITY_DN10504_c0_g1_i1.p1 TRINITY_DN10504_c0_g1~~TRINITY_DN10504_c0_g1_i1.p1  ORF type:complete len:531 (-),score=135.19 TRINITY_DN10504_c0_g1_i1:49-1608(-)